MKKSAPRKKHDPKFHRKPDVQKKKPGSKLKPAQPRELRKRGWMIAGFDTSMSSIAGAAIGYDRTLKKLRGPEFLFLRWTKEDEYLDRLREAAMAHNFIHVLQERLKLVINSDEIWIAQEEPVPMGMFNRGVSAFLKQQCEISGAFLGGLMRYGYTNIHQMGSITWRQMIAGDLGITTHHSKWRSPELAARYNCKPTDSGKFRSKQWAHMIGPPGYAFAGIFPGEIPDWPDIIDSKDGKKPRPSESRAKAVQPDDRYDALAIMWAEALELRELVEEISW